METVVSRPVMRALGVANVAVLLAGILAAVLAGRDGLPAAGARITVDGRASVTRVDGTTDALSSGDIVRAGEAVQAEEGSFVLELAGGGALEGRASLDRAADTRVVVGARPELVAGELLVLGDEGIDVDAGGTVVTLVESGAAARVDRGFAVRAGAYRGGVAVDSAGQERTVAALRQLGIASLGRPPGSAEPFLVDEADPWDRRFLGAAIDLGARLDGYSRAFTGDAVPGASRDVALFEAALPAVADEPAFPGALRSMSDQPPGELLVGTAIAVLGERGEFDDRWQQIFGFREDGAGWGLVALDQGVDDATLLTEVEAALVRARPTPEVAIGATPSADDDDATTTPGTGTTTTPTTTTPPVTPGGPTTTVPPTTPTTQPPGTTPTLPPVTVPPVTTPTLPPVTLPPAPDTGAPPIDDAADDTLGDLGGVLEDVGDLVEDTLDIPLPPLPGVPGLG